MTHPTRRLTEVVHQRHRLGVLTIALEVERVEFGYLREALDLTAGNLSRHLTVLVEAGLVDIEKGYVGKRPRTWVSITPAGADATRAELAALRSLLALGQPHTAPDGVVPAPPARGPSPGT